MTNLEIIKYIASNNPSRLSELLEDIYCIAWNDGARDKFGDESSIPSLEDWLYEDASKCGMYYEHELEEWTKTLDSPLTITAFYDGLSVTLPIDDPDHLWNKDIYNSKYEILDQAIGEIELLETIIRSEEIPNDVYDSFRTNECHRCNEPNCMASDVEICDCHKFENYYEV